MRLLPNIADRLVGRYQLLALLGEGGQARVYLALMAGPASFNKLLVVKLLSADLDDPLAVNAFLQEARLAAQVSHPNVVQTYEVGEADGHYYIAMEYLAGQSLAAINRRRAASPMPLELHLSVIADAARGLHHAHTLRSFDGRPLGIVHRDVSPQNVFVTYDGVTKLLDFGIAKLQGNNDLTRTGMIKGKVAYMAPEQFQTATIDHRADIFPLGVMLWQAVTGKRFAGGPEVSDLTKIQNRLTGAEPRLRAAAPDAPARLIEICDRALAVNPDERQASAEELADELTEYLSETSGAASPKRLSSLLTKMFAKERAELEALIDRRVREASEASAERAAPAVSDPTGTLVLPLSGQTSTGTRSNATPAPRAALGSASPRSRIPVVPLAALGAAIITGALVAVITQTRSESDAPQGAITVASAVPPARAIATSPAPASIRIRVEASPASAVATLDGEAISLPLDAYRPRDQELHVLSVSAPGHRTVERELSFEQGVNMVVALEREPEDRSPGRAIVSGPVRPRAARAGSPVARTATQTPQSEAPAPERAAADSAPQATEVPAPSPSVAAPATRAGRAPRRIDLENPYQ